MYKIGDKVETPHGTGLVVGYHETYDMYIVDLKGDFKTQQYKPEHLQPYRTAHEKLIEMGYELTKRSDYVFYRHDDLPRVTIYSDKTYSCSDTNLVLSRILTDYLEEMEGKE